MEIFKKMNKWIQWIIKSAEVYRKKPELVEQVLKSQNPVEEIDKYFSSEEQEEIKRLNKELKEDNLNKQLIDEYPPKDIYYKGRYLPLSDERIKVPVQVLITPEDPKIKNDLKKWGLYKANLEPEDLALKVYKKYMKTSYQYKYDKDNWNGLNEFWEFPFELYAKYPTGKWKADCDSHAIALVSYMRCAGVPAGYVWNVVGDCQLGGHSTVYVYSKKDQKFHHLNSTTNYFQFDHKEDLAEFPTHADAEGSDKLGIYNVWLSFNDLVGRSKFNKKQIGEILIK